MAGKKQTTPVMNSAHYDSTGLVRVFDSKTSCCVAAKNVNGKIHVFVANAREAIVQCPEIPEIFELLRTPDGQWHIWVVTCSGSVYRKLLTFSHCSNSESMDVDEPDGGTNSVFEDLLGDAGAACQNFDVPRNKATEKICDINESDKVLANRGDVISICCSESCLMLLCSENDKTSLQIYPTNCLQSEKPDLVQKLSLPFHRPSGGRQQAPKLYVVVPDCSNPCYISSSQFNIPSHLFSSIFGWESSVRELPALVCSLFNGSAYFCPIDLTAVDPTSSWQLLCSVDSPVRDVLPVRVNRTLTERESIAAELQKGMGLTLVAPSQSVLEAVVVVGASGKCCLMTALPTMGSVRSDYHSVISVFTLPGSVECVCSKDQTIFVSSGHHIYKCSLTLRRKDGGNNWKQLSVDVNSEELYVAAVSSMWISGHEDTLVCETANGDLVELDSDTSAEVAQDNISEHHQPSLKDLLLGVDLNQEKLTKLKTRQEQLNSFLQQLNFASHLMHFHHPQAAISQQTVPQNSSKVIAPSTPVSTKVTVQSEIGYHTVVYHLAVTLTNRSAVVLTQDWSLVVTLCAVYGGQSDSQTSTTLNSSPSSHTLELSQGLGPGQSVVFKLPILYSSSCPRLTVLVSLVLQAPVSLQADNDMKKLESLPRGLVVPVAEAVVDVFHFLHMRQPGCILPEAADPVSKIQETVSKLNHSGSSFRRSDAEKKQYQSYSISENLEVKSTSAVDILQVLLSDSQSDLDSLTSPSCMLQAPCGSNLSVSVEPVPEETTGGDETQPFAVTIKSCNVSLLARARLALRRRIQDQSMARKQSSAKGEELHAMMSKSEVLLQQLHGIQHKATEKSSTSSSDDVSQLYSLYETMRVADSSS